MYADLVVGAFTESKQPILGATVSLKETTSGADAVPETQTNTKSNRFDFGLSLEKPYMIVVSADGYFLIPLPSIQWD